MRQCVRNRPHSIAADIVIAQTASEEQRHVRQRVGRCYSAQKDTDNTAAYALHCADPCIVPQCVGDRFRPLVAEAVSTQAAQTERTYVSHVTVAVRSFSRAHMRVERAEFSCSASATARAPATPIPHMLRLECRVKLE